jgi:hypothetical protein
MTTSERKQLAFGLNRAIPDPAPPAVWGARLIAPNDLVPDRQDLIADSDAAKAVLVAWLDGPNRGDGAIRAMLDDLPKGYSLIAYDNEVHVLFEDARGVMVGSSNGGSGYMYVAGWLKPDASTVWYEVVRGPVPAERWVSVYGWTPLEVVAHKMGGTGSEVRCWRVDPQAYGFVPGLERRRELLGDFEYGYGGSGPHELARAIATDALEQWGWVGVDYAPAEAMRLVPEVFGAAQGKGSLTVWAADVLNRMETE